MPLRSVQERDRPIRRPWGTGNIPGERVKGLPHFTLLFKNERRIGYQKTNIRKTEP